jgi:hypothetical protein
VESELGNGSRFWFELPASKPSATPAETSQEIDRDNS